MQTHDQHQSPEAEKMLRPGTRCRKKLLKQSLLLHKENPAHGGNIGRRHKRDHEDYIQPSLLPQLRTCQQEGRRERNERSAQNHAYAKQQRIDDGLHVFCIADTRPCLIKIQAAISDDRLGKNRQQRAENQAAQKQQQHR